MTTNDDILKAMKKEQKKKLASMIMPADPITAEDIIKNHLSQSQPGQGGQKSGADSKMGAPKRGLSAEETVDIEDVFNIPNLQKLIKNDRHN